MISITGDECKPVILLAGWGSGGVLGEDLDGTWTTPQAGMAKGANLRL